MKIIDGFEKYSIDEGGVVRNIKNGKMIRPQDRGNGYLFVRLSKKGVRTPKYLHRLLAETFLDNLEGKPNVNHIDNNPRNNDLSNLEWCTQKENIQHSARQRRMVNSNGEHKGSGNPSSKLTENDVLNIRQLLTDGVKQNKIGCLFGVHQMTISNIKLGRSWAWF